jgi:K(+)-stimulated pyrophosphate-energized sodium pump
MDPIVDEFKALLDVHVNAWMFACLCVGVFAVVVAFVLHHRVLRSDSGPDAMKRVGRAIHVGARAFLRMHVAATLLVTTLGAAALLLAFNRAGDAWTTALAFLVGCVGSMLAGMLGLRVAAIGGVRSAQAAATRGLGAALRKAYASGAAAALFTTGIAVASMGALYLGTNDPRRLFAFALGASTAALIGRVGGGIFAKAADVGLSLAIRADQDVPDDSPTNPGVIADDVGDDVGDVLGMGADLFESVAAATLAAMALGAGAWAWVEKHGTAEIRAAIDGLAAGPATLVLYPLALSAVGIVAAMLAAPFVKTENERHVGAALHRSVMVSAVLFTAGAVALTFTLGLATPEVTQALTGAGRDVEESWRYAHPAGTLWAVLVGLALGVALGRVAEWHTSENRPPARKLAEDSGAGPATNVLAGLALGMSSCAWPAVMTALGAGLAYYLAGVYGVGLAAVGLLATMASTLAVHAFGPVAENASGLGEMLRFGPDTRRRTDALDGAAATTAATGKAYAAGAATLVVLALFAAYREAFDRLHPETPLTLDLSEVRVQLGLLIGAMIPFLYASFCIRAVGRVARTLSEQIVKQCRESMPLGRDEGPPPDHAKFVYGGARRAIRRLGPAALVAVGAPIVCGFSPLGARGLAALLIGAMLSGSMLAVALTNAGAAWDNAKRYVASGVFGGKGSPAYKASVTGDVVGDPMKDAAGPGLHVLIKLMAILSLVILPLLPG